MRMSLSAGAGKGELGGHMATDAFFGDIVFSLSPAEPKTCFFDTLFHSWRWGQVGVGKSTLFTLAIVFSRVGD